MEKAMLPAPDVYVTRRCFTERSPLAAMMSIQGSYAVQTFSLKLRRSELLGQLISSSAATAVAAT